MSCRLLYQISELQLTSSLTKQRCYPETKTCSYGTIIDYWDKNGALPVFGYPISTVRENQSGSTSLFQWFERNRLEYYPPTTGRGAEVLLGRLGAEQLKGGVEPKVAKLNQPDCLYFDVTGHNVCNRSGIVTIGFKGYWEGHRLQDPARNAYQNSLMLFGYPLTEAKPEKGPDGKTRITQWFERARFEYHEEYKGTPYQVLLGQLGREGGGAQP
jgi:hypothetical protein